jgi:pyrroloquinoline-quinone synthase
MRVHPRLLEHPFYQSWSNGDVSIEQLARYHRSYAEFIERIPSYWHTVVSAFQPHTVSGHPVIREEEEHIRLWSLWGEAIPAATDYPRLEKLIAALDVMTPSRLLGAIQAFELQQPEVAQTKKEGLLRHYGIRGEFLTYFDEHLKEEKHIAYGQWIADQFADRKEFAEGLETGAALVYESLDAFVLNC